PFYVVPDASESFELFSNVRLVRQLLYPNQGLYYFGGVHNQSALAVFKSLSPVQSVSLNDRANLPQASSATSLLGQNEGWYYDSNSDTLFVKYVSTGNDSVRVFFMNQSSSTTSLSSVLIDFGIVISFVAVAVVAAVFLYRRSRNKRNPMQQRESLSWPV
ncbi:MAG: hypothetical protein ACREBQ_08965, partial [Nitrososphaerales archaeon]